MRKISLFIAMSLDGISQIGMVKLIGQDAGVENNDVYDGFIKNINTVVMGWNTYRQITTELSPNEWVYDDLKTYVITHHEHPSTENIKFVNTDPEVLIKKLKNENGKDIWICGGAKLVQQLVYEDLIDYYHITVIPTILGAGLRLFEKTKDEIKLKLLDAQAHNGMTDLSYTRR